MRLIRRFFLTAVCAPLPLTFACLTTQMALPAAALAQGATSATQTPPTPQQRRVQDLITQAETAYKSGVSNYNSKHLDAARMDFDSSVDLILSSGIDLKSEPALNDELEHLLSAINSLELFALKQGNGFSPPVEETPLESVADMTFPPNPELVAKLKGELNTTSDLPLVINDQVAGYINIFAQSNSFRAHMSASMQRLGKYRTLIQNVLKEEGVPQDLIYLAVAESGFQAQVVNTKSGAGGMWQFMTYTGPQYGLTRNAYFDYRFDPEKSTRAYAKYMKALYAQLGDWYLAMASYDWGPGNIQRVVSRTGYADFWELYRRGVMPAETRAYVPQILAAVIMAKNPEKYGLNKLPPSPPVIYDTVPTNYGISLALVGDLTNATVPELVALNPSMLRLATPRDIAFDLHLPPGTREAYLERLKDIPEDKRMSWRFHVAKPGETLESISTSFRAHADDVARINEITAAKPLAANDELVIPITVAAAAPTVQRYTPRRADTLVTVADRFGVTVEQLRSWNHLSGARLTPGRSLYVTEPVRLAPGARATRGRGRGTARSLQRGKANSRRGAAPAGKKSHGRASTSARTSSRSAPKAAAKGSKRKHR